MAAARNAGIHASKGAFVAFIDADDLWHPTKIEVQMEALLAEEMDVALVYSPFRVIDMDGNVIASSPRHQASGWVLYRHLHANIVGNGSSVLVRKGVLQELGGFDPWLREQGADDIAVFGGGIIPAEDIRALKAMGVKELFTPGTSTQDIIRFVRENIRAA